MKTITQIVLIAALLFAGACSKAKHSSAAGDAARSKPYVASVRRDPFHKSSCRWAKKIRAENLVGYDTRQQAVEDDHRPCKVCQP